jgi:predicted SAM-dependent methyltransferase
LIVDRLKRTESPIARGLLLRGRALPHALTRGHVVRRRAVRAYLAGTAEPKLQLGAGPNALPGWLNSDLIAGDVYLDLRRRLPLPDASFAYAFGEHVIEHVSEADGARLLAELHRVLRPGGVVRVTTPDLAKIVALYEDRNPVIGRAEYARYLAATTGKAQERGSQVFNDFMRLWGHRYVYDEEDLTAKLRAAGFSSVERAEPGESRHPALRGAERHGAEPWVNAAEAMCIEATR